MTTFPEDRRYFEQYKLNRVVTRSQTPHNQAWWPEGSDPGGANAGIPPNDVEPSGEGERLSRKRSLSTSSGELPGDDQKYDAEEAAKEVEKHIPLDRKTASHDAQLKRLENAQASKRSRTRLKTMKEQLDETQKQLDENKIALKLAEERARQAEERERQLLQQLENKR
ncbi:hypothetical protein E4U24_002658 [Claviceps purpurea]|nr:hypothetical protein E4U37_001572 [Claviceps purpurea]KAG6196745.1 hypothetical protein E4U10_000696 [Claviceps purpurea]KAG6203383.1 hypothetical protein E4U34_000593 [Claviceps purpurea]KAG6214427.1 hypothetical protein E4U26_000350 [Claviceps purpurea]KAG6239189.1 hypothetical protein E4U25_001045 [Claviceps purpurea]